MGWSNLIDKIIENKIYVFVLAIAMAIFYRISDENLGKFSALKI